MTRLSPKNYCLSSPRAKRAGPKGLRAESARAFTGRQCPHSGKGEDLLKSCSKKKVAFAQIIKGGNVILGDFLGLTRSGVTAVSVKKSG